MEQINRMLTLVMLISILTISNCATINACSHSLDHNLSTDCNISVTHDNVHRIDKLPGQPENVKFSQYGGYITVDREHGKAFYYYFVEIDDDHRQPNDSTTPLVLWLNGGPGCSSMMGAMTELGPFRVKSNGNELYRNPYAWIKVANVLFLDTPAGAGFSYSNTTSDFVTGDAKTAEDNYAFMVNWLDQFPEYKGRDLYLTGESYAGHYVPQLAEKIVEHNKDQANKNGTINLKGIAVGNPVLEKSVDFVGKGHLKYLNQHDFITDEEYDDLLRSCDFSVAFMNRSQECHLKINTTNKIRIDAFNNYNTYNIYAPLCHMNKTIANIPDEISITNFDPCTNNYTNTYLNTPDVRQALHATVTMFGAPWQRCSNAMSKSWNESSSVLPTLSTLLLQNNIRILVYSGDTDMAIPYTLTREDLKTLNLTVKVGRTPWYSNNEFAGISVIFKEGLTMATVRGSGHEVPSYQPERALTMITSFLKGQPLPVHP